MLEQILRLGRRGRSYRPFCEARGVSPRGYSGPLQRTVTDFGADSSFGAAAKMREHYRIDVPVGAVRRHTLQHGKAIACLSDEPVNRLAKQLLTPMDGSMIPVMEPGRGADRRKAKQLYWREVRLCLARAADREQACYGATLGSPMWTSPHCGSLLSMKRRQTLRLVARGVLSIPPCRERPRFVHCRSANRVRFHNFNLTGLAFEADATSCAHNANATLSKTLHSN